MKNRFLLFILILAGLMNGCQKDGAEMASADTVLIKVVPEIPATKALVDLGTDDLYMYSMSSGTLKVASQTSITDGCYYFDVPADVEYLMFSNVNNYTGSFDMTWDSANTMVLEGYNSSSYYYDYSNTDLVAGIVPLADLTSDGTLPVHLTRLCCFVSMDMTVKTTDGKQLNVNDHVSSIRISFVNQTSSVTLKAAADSPVTSTEKNESYLSKSCSSTVQTWAICDDYTLLPTVPGSNAVMQITISNNSGEFEYEKDLGYAFERNTRYNLHLSLTSDETGFSGFTVETMIEENVDVNFD